MNGGESTKTFRNLIAEVHEPGLCGQCGGCVSFCSAGDLLAIGIGEEGKPQFINEENCLECGICYLICPQIDALDDDIKYKFQWKAPIGSFLKIVSARSCNSEIRSRATDGGVVSAMLHCMLNKKMIDGAIVSKITTHFGREPMIATSYDDILTSAGSRFTGSASVEELSRFSTYSPNIYAIKEIENMDLLKIAVVGTPCQVHTIRKMQSLNVVPSHIVNYILGLFCIESFTFDASKKEDVESILDAKLDDIKKMNIRKDFTIMLKNGETRHIPLKKMEQFCRPACLACSDFTNDFADISFGGLGSPNGWTTVIIRTEKGETLFREAIHHGFIEELEILDDMLKEQIEEIGVMTKRLEEFAQIKMERARIIKKRK